MREAAAARRDIIPSLVATVWSVQIYMYTLVSKEPLLGILVSRDINAMY